MNEIEENFKGELLGIEPHIFSACMLTAENPLGVAVSAAENNSLMKKLYQLLKDGHYVYRKIKGKFASNVEHNVLICNVALDEAKSLAARFSQEAFVYGVKKHSAATGKSDRGPMMMFAYYGIDNGKKFAQTQKIVDTGGNGRTVGVVDPAMYRAQAAGDKLDPEAPSREDNFSVRKNFKFAVSFSDFSFWLKDMETNTAALEFQPKKSRNQLNHIDPGAGDT